MNGNVMAAEMAEQPAVLARLVARAPQDAEAVGMIVPRPLAGIVLLARGSSDNAAVLGRYLTELAAGRPAGLAAPSLYTRYRAQVDWRGYLVVALSQSGATPEIVTTCRAVRTAGAAVVGITNVADSELASASDVVLAADAGLEHAIPATKTVTAQMLLLITVAQALGPVDATAEQLLELPAAVKGILDDSRPIDLLADRWAQVDRLVVAGRGLGYAAALECALKVKETTGILAEGISTADLRHGPIAAVNAGAPVLLVDAGGPVLRDLADLRRLLTDRHAEMSTLPLGSPLPELLQVLMAVVRGQQLARALALVRRVDPDTPATLTKITLTA
jgi:glucosamine--fructose-6-phosphate aminotransferase (isomerizing)